MAVKRNYRINLRNYGNPPAIMVSQYDENYDLVFEVYDGVVPATGLNAYTVKLVGRQPGDDPALKYEFTGTVSGIANNILSFTIDTTMTGRAGKGTAEIVILDATNDVKFASFNLPVYVEKAAVPDDAIDADVERAQEIAEQVEELIDGATEGAEAWAVGQRGGVDVESTDPTYHNNAKYYSEVAQDIADSIGIDATLSISGKAADAKKTGDEISSLKEDLTQIDEIVDTLYEIKIPSEYQQVEYIECNNDQYFDIGIKPQANDKITAIFTIADNRNQIIIGSRSSGAYNTSTDQVYINATASSALSNPSCIIGFIGQSASVKVSNYSFDTKYTITLDVPNDYSGATKNYVVCALNNLGYASSGSRLKGKLYGVTITGRSNLIPCYRKSDSVVGLYDTAQGIFFTPEENKTVTKGENVTGVTNILLLGAKNDGSEDVGAIINGFTGSTAIYMPQGKYLVETPIKLKNPLFGDGHSREKSDSGVTALISNIDSGSVIEVDTNHYAVSISDLNIILHDDENAIDFMQSGSGSKHYRSFVRNVGIFDIGDGIGINISPTTFDSRAVFVDNCTIFAKPNCSSVGIYGASNGSDSRITNTEIMYTQVGISLNGGVWYLANVHVWCGGNGSTTQSWYEGTKCIYQNGGQVIGTNIYLDTAINYIYFYNQPALFITNMILWDDGIGGSFNLNQHIVYRQTPNNGQLCVNGGWVRTNKKLIVNDGVLNKYRDFRIINESALTESNYDKSLYYPTSTNDSNYYIQRTISQNGSFVEVADIITPQYGQANIRMCDDIGGFADLKIQMTNNSLSISGNGNMSVYYKQFTGFVRIYAASDSGTYKCGIDIVSAFNCAVAMLQSVSGYNSLYAGEVLTSDTGLTEIELT